jgi:hypothetical protein
MKKENMLKTLGQVYAWVGTICGIYLTLVEPTDNILLLLKMIVILAFMYDKNNWRMAVLILTSFTVIWSIFLFDAIYLFDILGMSLIFWYALKYRK